jgi:hypothetical protein
MANETGISTFIPNINTATILNWTLYGLIIILAVGIIGYITYYIIKKRRYGQYRIEILDRDENGNVYKDYDKAGVFLDKKTGLRLLFLDKAKIGLNPNNIPYVSSREKTGFIIKKETIIKTVYLRRIGVNNYVFIHVKVNPDNTIISVGEEDLNNAVQEMSKIRRKYDKKSWWDENKPIVVWIITIMIIMIIMLVLFNKFTILEEVSKNMLDITKLQKEIAELMLNTSKSTALNPGMPIIVPGGG